MSIHCQTCPHSKSSKAEWPCMDCLQGDRKPSADPRDERIFKLESLLLGCLPFVNEYMAEMIGPWISYETRNEGTAPPDEDVVYHVPMPDLADNNPAARVKDLESTLRDHRGTIVTQQEELHLLRPRVKELEARVEQLLARNDFLKNVDALRLDYTSMEFRALAAESALQTHLSEHLCLQKHGAEERPQLGRLHINRCAIGARIWHIPQCIRNS